MSVSRKNRRSAATMIWQSLASKHVVGYNTSYSQRFSGSIVYTSHRQMDETESGGYAHEAKRPLRALSP